MTARKPGLVAATRRTVRALRRAGSLEEVDSLSVASVLFTADALDHLEPDTSPAQRASLIRAHLAAVKLLLGRDGADSDDAYAAVIEALSTPLGYAGEMGDAPTDGQPWPR
jgi:hypothetical protein